MNGIFRIILCLAVSCSTIGCASLMTDNNTPVKVETVTADGVDVKEASCAIVSGVTRTEFKTPAVIPLRKSSADVYLECKKEGLPDGRANLVARAGAATYGNILAGGIIGAVVDQSTGKAYNYPEWVRVVMGKYLNFDRSDHKDGVQTPGKDALDKDKKP